MDMMITYHLSRGFSIDPAHPGQDKACPENRMDKRRINLIFINIFLKQINKGKDKNPNQVNKMPEKSGNF